MVVIPIADRKANDAFEGLYEETWSMNSNVGHAKFNYKSKHASYGGFSIHLDKTRVSKSWVDVDVQLFRNNARSSHTFRQGVHITDKYISQCFPNLYRDDVSLLLPIINYLVSTC